MSGNDFIVKKKVKREQNVVKLKEMEKIAKSTANKVYGEEVSEKPTKNILISITPTAHSKLIKYCAECKVKGKEEHSNFSKLFRDLLIDFMKENQL